MDSPQIYQAVIDAMGQVSAISKDRKNGTQGFSYRGIDDVMNELHGILSRCGIFIVPTVLDEQRSEGITSRGGVIYYTRLKIKFTFYAKDGSYIESVVIGEAMDTGDKASNKALSIGLKYACLQVFCIPTEEDKDPDSVSYDFVPQGQSAPQNTQQVKNQQNIQPQIDNSVKETRLKLKTIIERYGQSLNSKAYDMCCEAMAGNDIAKVTEMLNRSIAYLGKKGVAISWN